MPLSTELSDKQLLGLLREENNQAFDLLYRRCYASIEHFVLQNNGDRHQAKDLFQETVCVLLTTVREPDFELTSSLKTYVFAISKNLWLKQLKKLSRWTDLEEAEEHNTWIAPVEPEPTPYEQLTAIFSKMTVRCLKLLSAIFFGKKEIADVVRDGNYANIHSAQNQKYKCLQQARKISGSV